MYMNHTNKKDKR